MANTHSIESTSNDARTVDSMGTRHLPTYSDGPMLLPPSKLPIGRTLVGLADGEVDLSHEARLSSGKELALKCVYTNCLSLLNKLPELKLLAHRKRPHIIALTETWLAPEISDNETYIPGFHIIRAGSSRGRSGGFLHI